MTVSSMDESDQLDLHDALVHIETIIGSSASAIIAAPEYNLTKLKDLLSCLNRTHLGPFDAKQHRKTILAIHRLVAKTATKVFEDIIPAYRIKQHDSEDQVKVSKDVQKLRQYERALSSIYKNLYLDYVKRMLDSAKKNPPSTFYTQLIRSDASDRENLAETAIDCFGRVLLAQPHFNYRDQLIANLVEYSAQTRNERCSDIAHRYLSETLRHDKLGEVSLEVVSCISDLSKTRKFSVSANLFKTLLNLRLINVKAAVEEEKANRKSEKEKLAAMKKQQSRKERKRMKKMKKLKSELLETEAHTTNDQKLKYHKLILKKLFVTYFRLLKNHEELGAERKEIDKFVKLLPPVLEGMAKFAHLIDVNLCNDMFPFIRRLLENQSITTNCKLNCLSTVFIMLKSLESELGKIDPESFYRQFYIVLTNLNSNNLGDQEFSSLITCIHLMLLKRARNVNNKRYYAFVRRLLILTLNLKPVYAIKLLDSVMILFNHRSSVSALLDSANCSNFGSGQYDMETEDPDFSNADSSVAWELHMLRNHNDANIRDVVKKYFSDIQMC